MEKTILIDGEIGWEITAQEIRRQLNAAKGEDVIFEISSPGGSVFEGIEIFNVIRDYKGKTTSKIIGLAASMASYIAVAVDKVIIHDNAVFMIHNPWTWTAGNQNELRKTADILDGLAVLLANEYSKKSGKPVDEIRSLMDEDSFFFGSEIFDAGFADEIIESQNGSVVDKENNILKSKALIHSCMKKMKESEEMKNDIDRAAALLPMSKKDKHKKAEGAINIHRQQENKIKGEKKMDINELKAKHPELYNSVFSLGVTSGITSVMDNIEAHGNFFDVAPDAVFEAIQKNEQYAPKHAAKYQKASFSKKDIQDIKDDDQGIGDIQAPIQEKDGAKIALNTFEKELFGNSAEGGE